MTNPDPLQSYVHSARWPGHVVCKCGKGYGSLYDGLCFRCRGCTVEAAKLKAMSPAARAFAKWCPLCHQILPYHYKDCVAK